MHIIYLSVILLGPLTIHATEELGQSQSEQKNKTEAQKNHVENV